MSENVTKLRELFPEVFSEGKIDFKKLEEELGQFADSDGERYNFTWAGKSEAKKIAQTPSTGTLRPSKFYEDGREDSKNWDTTQNLYIEGDNLEVLKLLQKSYHKKVKMIYIDPPYNTGKDFVYKDNFHDNIRNYLEITGQVDSEGKRLSANAETNGRYHSDWLNMMYSRLKLARNLLQDDGVIFISIDDNEVANLRKICDEIFGEDNFVGEIIRKTRTSTNHDEVGLNTQHEYCLVIAKSITNAKIIGQEKTFENYKNPDNDINGDWISADPGANLDGRSKVNNFEIINPYTGKVDLPAEGNHWRFNEESFKEMLESGKVFFKKEHKENERGFVLKRYKGEVRSKYHLLNSLEFATNEYLNQVGTRERNDIFNKDIFDYPKPIKFISSFVNAVDDKNAIVLDFFSGSATTAHAVMQLNAEDGGSRKFICVQLPEATEENGKAQKAGYKNICEIGKERIRRAGDKIIADNPDKDLSGLDIGFKVLKLDSSNIKAWDSDFGNLQKTLEDAVDNIKSDRSPEDLLYEVLLKYGLDLTLPIEEKAINGSKVYVIGFGALIVCFDSRVTLDTVRHIAKLKEEYLSEITRVVFKDSSFADTVVKTNALQELKQFGIDEVVSI